MSERYRIVSRGEWGVINYDGELYPERWATEDDAWNFGVAGKYLLTGDRVVEVATVTAMPDGG